LIVAKSLAAEADLPKCRHFGISRLYRPPIRQHRFAVITAFSRSYDRRVKWAAACIVRSVMAKIYKSFKRLMAFAVVSALPAMAANLTLKPATLKAWDEYLERAEAKVDGATPLKTSAERSTAVKVEPAVGTGTLSVPGGGLIHDWIGTTFVANVTVAQLQSVLRDYDHYKDMYTPTVIESRSLESVNGTDTFSMEWFHKVLNITTAIDADYANTQVAAASDAGYMITRSTRIQEIRNLGREDEEKLPVGTGSGFIWKICSILRYQQADGGVYLRLEAIVLSRDIPHSVRWIANPIVNHLSRNSLMATLSQTGEAVETRSARLTGDSIAQAR
jgi:hypothetical protein